MSKTITCTASAVMASVVKKPAASPAAAAVYSFREPVEKLPWRSHFSSLLLSADWLNTAIELTVLLTLTAMATLLPASRVDVPGSMRLGQLSAFLWAASLTRRVYNAYLEAVFFACPARRTQPPREHALKAESDLCGRDREQLAALVYHDRMTLLSQLTLVLALYYGVPGFYPAFDSRLAGAPVAVRLARLVAHHYLLSFGMYWAHRALHVVPFLWRRIHVIHHWARHPLSRNTYQDHWLDNFGNAVVGEVAAQILLPIDGPFFVVSRLFRIMESLEKHAGVCGATNLAHSAQRWLPYAQMPHHHDWHHEGHKSCNFTFAALGGVWDCWFGTRKTGRAMRFPECATSRDVADDAAGKRRATNPLGNITSPAIVLSPVLAVVALAAAKLAATRFSIA